MAVTITSGADGTVFKRDYNFSRTFKEAVNIQVNGNYTTISGNGDEDGVSFTKDEVTIDGSPAAADHDAYVAQLNAVFPEASTGNGAGGGVQNGYLPVRVAATGNINIASAPATIDGITLASGNRVLLPAQTTVTQNGIYVFNGAAAAMTRSTDLDASGDIILGGTVAVSEGTDNGGTIWVVSGESGPVLDTDDLVFIDASSGGALNLPVVSSEWATDPYAHSVWIAKQDIGNFADGAPVGTPTQLVSGGPNITSSGAARPAMRYATANSPACYGFSGAQYWDAPNKAAFDWLTSATGSGAYKSLTPSTIIKVIKFPVGTAGTQLIFSTNNANPGTIGISLYLDTTFVPGKPVLYGQMAYGTAPSETVFMAFDAQNFVLGQWNTVMISISVGRPGGDVQIEINGLPAGSVNLNSIGALGSTTANIARFGAMASGILPMTAEIAAMGFFQMVYTADELRSKYKYICDLLDLPVMGKMIDYNTAYSQCAFMYDLSSSDLRAIWMRNQTHIDYTKVTIPEEKSPDKGWNWGPTANVLATGTDTYVGPIIPSKIDGVWYSISGVDASATAHIRRYYNGAWSAPVQIDLGYASGNTYSESRIIQLDNGDFGCMFYEVAGTPANGIAKFATASTWNGAWTVRASLPAGYGEATPVLLPDGDIFVVANYTFGSADPYGFIISADYTTVTPTGQTFVAGSCSRPDLTILPTGDLLLIYRTTRIVMQVISAANVALHHFTGADWSEQIPVGPLDKFGAYGSFWLDADEADTVYVPHGFENNAAQDIRHSSVGFATFKISGLQALMP